MNIMFIVPKQPLDGGTLKQFLAGITLKMNSVDAEKSLINFINEKMEEKINYPLMSTSFFLEYQEDGSIIKYKNFKEDTYSIRVIKTVKITFNLVLSSEVLAKHKSLRDFDDNRYFHLRDIDQWIREIERLK